MKFAYFAGCTIPFRENNYELSARKVFERLGVTLVDMEGSGCCGFYVEYVDHLTWLVLAARNICIAEKMGLNIMTLCNGCLGSLAKANHILKTDPETRKKVNEILKDVDMEFKGNIRVEHLVEILAKDLGTEKIEEAVIRPLEGLKIAVHYGCHMLRPSDILEFDDPEDPKILDELVNATGATSITYMEKGICCGAPVMAIDVNLALQIGQIKLTNIEKVGADAMVTACPFCHIMYESSQLMTERELSVPVLHYPQLLGLAMGISYEELGLNMNRVDACGILKFLK